MESENLDKTTVEAIKDSKEAREQEREEYIKSFIRDRNKILKRGVYKPIRICVVDDDEYD